MGSYGNIAQSLAESAARWPDACAVDEVDREGGRRRTSYYEFSRRVQSGAWGLRARGLQPGDRVAVLLGNERAYLEVWFALATAGLVAVPLNVRLLEQEHGHMLRDSDARLLVADEHLLADRPGLISLPELGVITVGDDRGVGGRPTWESLMTGAERLASTGSAELCSLMYTSGTTGLPKAVMLSHRAWLEVASYVREYLQYADGEVTIHCAPLTHGAGFLVLPTLQVGGRNLLVRKFDPGKVLALLADEAVNNGFFVPSMIRMLLDGARRFGRRYPALRSLYYAGSAISERTVREALAEFGPVLVQSYAQMECPMFVTVLTHEDHAAIASGAREDLVGSAGKCVRDACVRIDAPGGPAGVGEILVKAPQIMEGYWNRSDAAAKTMNGGWLHTGDIGRLDREGYLFVIDRLKDMIISGGMNIYAQEVERVLLEIDGVREAAVIGVPDDQWGERVVAVLVKEAGATIADSQVVDRCRSALPGYRRPKEFRWLSELPRNSYGKVLKRHLREQIMNSNVGAR